MTTPIDSLYERFPLTFRRVCRDQPFTAAGFQCGDGWADIIAGFAEIAEPICAADPSYNPSLRDDAVGYVHQLIGQVKEKFGGLRIYEGNFAWRLGDGRYASLYSALDNCVRLAWRTCEVCGEPGERRTGNWIKTLCDTHAADHGRIGM